MSNDVTTVRPELEKALPDWTLVRDVIAGQTAVKAKKTVYLPKPNPADKSAENDTRYDQYIERATFFNATGRTMNGMVGIAYRRWPEIEVPPAMDVIKTDTDGAGGGLINQSHRVLEGVLQVGRAGLLTDYPARNGSVSIRDQAEENIHPIITSYDAENIINWRLGGDNRLSLVVLKETIEEPDEFGVEETDQWRELSMGSLSTEDEDVTPRYVVRVWRRDSDSGQPEIKDEFVPTDGAGKEWNHIPFTFVGAVDNNAEIDRAPLFDLATLNIAHYRNSADYEESSYFVGQPTFAFAGLSEQWIKDVWNDTVYVGSRAAIPLPDGGSATLLQASPNTLAGEAMKTKEQQMVSLGARLLIQGEAVKTAEQSRSETAANHSVLSLAADNVSAAYTLALQWAAQFQPVEGSDIRFEIPTDFTGLVADPQLVTALVQGWQSGAFPNADLWAALRQIGIIDQDKDDEAVAEEIEMQGGGLELDDASGFSE